MTDQLPRDRRIRFADPEPFNPLIREDPQNVVGVGVSMKVKPRVLADHFGSAANMLEADDPRDLEPRERGIDRVRVLSASLASEQRSGCDGCNKVSSVHIDVFPNTGRTGFDRDP